MLSVMVELSISTSGVDEWQARSAIEERLERLRAGATLKDLPGKKGGGGNDVDYATRRLMFEFGADAIGTADALKAKFGAAAFAEAWVKVQHESDDKFYVALMAELETTESVTT